MKVLSIRQPWASLIINGYKQYEFRTWKTKYRGELLIHASASVEKDNLKRFEKLNLDFPTGCILGKVTLIDCVKVTQELENKLIEKDELVYGATKDRTGYGFEIDNIVKFDKVINAKGQLGFWNYYNDDE